MTEQRTRTANVGGLNPSSGSKIINLNKYDYEKITAKRLRNNLKQIKLRNERDNKQGRQCHKDICQDH